MVHIVRFNSKTKFLPFLKASAVVSLSLRCLARLGRDVSIVVGPARPRSEPGHVHLEVVWLKTISLKFRQSPLLFYLRGSTSFSLRLLQHLHKLSLKYDHDVSYLLSRGLDHLALTHKKC